jgi:hypothetical protein
VELLRKEEGEANKKVKEALLAAGINSSPPASSAFRVFGKPRQHRRSTFRALRWLRGPLAGLVHSATTVSAPRRPLKQARKQELKSTCANIFNRLFPL